MTKRKKIREQGKIKFSWAFQEFNQGDVVSVVREKSKSANFPKRIQGRCGVIEEKRGRSFIVRINDLEKEKKFIINPLHLKRLVMNSNLLQEVKK